jgi:hypothetical protein
VGTQTATSLSWAEVLTLVFFFLEAINGHLVWGDEHQITCTRGGRALAQTMLVTKNRPTGQPNNQQKKPDYS